MTTVSQDGELHRGGDGVVHVDVAIVLGLEAWLRFHDGFDSHLDVGHFEYCARLFFAASARRSCSGAFTFTQYTSEPSSIKRDNQHQCLKKTFWSCKHWDPDGGNKKLGCKTPAPSMVQTPHSTRGTTQEHRHIPYAFRHRRIAPFQQ